MALWTSISISLACLVIGYAVACWTEGSSRDDLEHQNFYLEIENERLKRRSNA